MAKRQRTKEAVLTKLSDVTLDPQMQQRLEQAYRRGYSQGYWQAMDDGGLGITEHAMTEFFELYISRWRYRLNLSNRRAPPRLQSSKDALGQDKAAYEKCDLIRPDLFSDTRDAEELL